MRYLHKLRWRMPVAAVICGALATGTSYAYQKVGHFYSTFVFGQSMPRLSLTAPEQRLLAFCAQLPDQSKDLDAVATYRYLVLHHPLDWARWGAFDYTGSDGIRRMVTVQQLVHGLTGGTADDVRGSTKQIVMRLADGVSRSGDRRVSICALGIGMHLLEDSYAHQRMAEDESLMYSTGVGHAADLSYPDYPLCDGLTEGPHATYTCQAVGASDCPPVTNGLAKSRFCRWADFLGQDALSPTPVASQSAAATVAIRDLRALVGSADDLNSWREQAGEGALLKDLHLPPEFQKFFAAHNASDSCQALLDSAAADASLQLVEAGAPVAGRPLSCKDVWNIYAPTAVDVFTSNERAGKNIRERRKQGSWTDVYECPFDLASKPGSPGTCI